MNGGGFRCDKETIPVDTRSFVIYRKNSRKSNLIKFLERLFMRSCVPIFPNMSRPIDKILSPPPIYHLKCPLDEANSTGGLAKKDKNVFNFFLFFKSQYEYGCRVFGTTSCCAWSGHVSCFVYFLTLT